MTLERLPRRCLLAMAGVIALLIAASIAAEGWRDLLHRADHGRLVAFFDADLEHNLPTWYSSCQLLLAALLLGEIAVLRRLRRAPFVTHWAVLAAIFAYLATDESLILHEQLTPLLRQHFHFHGLLDRAWVVPAGALLVVFALAYLRFLAHLPARTRLLFVISGAIYVGGAMGIEMINADWRETLYRSIRHHAEVALVMQNVEELMELSGIALFVYTLLQVLIAESRIGPPPPAVPAQANITPAARG